MTKEAPERLWIEWAGGEIEGVEAFGYLEKQPFTFEYLRADLVEALEAENARLVAFMESQSACCTCSWQYTERGLVDPGCEAALYGDEFREAIGLPPLCQFNIKRAALGETSDD